VYVRLVRTSKRQQELRKVYFPVYHIRHIPQATKAREVTADPPESPATQFLSFAHSNCEIVTLFPVLQSFV
jgi:hypothetical protein